MVKYLSILNQLTASNWPVSGFSRKPPPRQHGLLPRRLGPFGGKLQKFSTILPGGVRRISTDQPFWTGRRWHRRFQRVQDGCESSVQAFLRPSFPGTRERRLQTRAGQTRRDRRRRRSSTASRAIDDADDDAIDDADDEAIDDAEDESINDAAFYPCHAVLLVQDGHRFRRSLLDGVLGHRESAPDSDRSGAQSRVAVH